MQYTPEDIKAIRRKLKLTQSQLSYALNVTVTTVSRWENGGKISRYGCLVLSEFIQKNYEKLIK